MHSILVFIPAKNEASTIAEVIADSRRIIAQSMSLEADVLVISDGSTDNTVPTATNAGARVIAHSTSQGLGTIFREAVDYAVQKRYDYLVTIDGDKQFDESEIPLLLKPIIDDTADFTSGNRFMHGNDIAHMSTAKKVGNRIVARLVNYILKSSYTDVSCGFRAYSREALLHLNLYGGFTYTQEVFLNLGFKGMRIKEIPISVTYYPTRKSRIASKLFNYGYQVLKIMVSCMLLYRPFRLFGTIATLCLAVSIPILGFTGYYFITTESLTPYKALAAVGMVSFVLALLFFIVGIVMHSFSKLQMNSERVLYYQKRNQV